MARVTLPLIGEVGSTFELVESVTATGTGQIWNDASAATYADYVSGNARSPIEVSPLTVPALNYRVEVVIKTNFGTSQPGLGVTIYQYGFGQLSSMLGGTAYVGDDGWIHCPQSVEFPSGLADALNGLATPVAIVGMFAPGRVYEGKVIVNWGSDAPPCRIFPRSDGLGVGAGRNYPPAKSQQRSSRGVGYY